MRDGDEKREISDTAKRLAAMPARFRHRYYRMKISQHNPPKTAHDRFMLKIYQTLLDQPDDLRSIEEIDRHHT